jgi:hypothetical protein
MVVGEDDMIYNPPDLVVLDGYGDMYVPRCWSIHLPREGETPPLPPISHE